ncbi:MAG TPA: dockerin type I repeat-containing protein, partial [Bacteroidales bacterium]|nr:dockerin type I repeat-containing protein [Bacteroidales bacterium]
MKHVLFHLALMAIMPFLFTISVQATMLDVEQPFAFSECEAYAPDVPDLPDEEDILYGDANDDGVINVLDIIAVVNYISGLNPDPFNFEAADMNNDGNVNVLDIIFETNVIMEVQGIP